MESADLTNPDDADRILDETIKWNNGVELDAIWCCAGYFIDVPIQTLRDQMDTVVGAYYVEWTESFIIPRHPIFTASTVSFFTVTGYSPYSPPKAAIRNLSDVLVQEIEMYNGARRKKDANAPATDVKIHIVFPMGISSPCFENEQKLKPALTHIMEEADEKDSKRHGLRGPWSLTAHYDHPICYLIWKFLPLYIPAALFCLHMTTYMIFLALVSLEGTFTHSGYSALPMGILLGGMARRTELQVISGGDGNYGAWGILDGGGDSTVGGSDSIEDDMREDIVELDIDKIRRAVEDAKSRIGDSVAKEPNKGFESIKSSEANQDDNKTILIYGGSTGTGTIAIQFAKLAGYTVITTASPKHFDLVKARGADLNSPTVGGDIRKATDDKLIKVLDTVGKESSAKISVDALSSKGGTYVKLLGEYDAPRSDVESIFFLVYGITGDKYIFEGKHCETQPTYFEFAKKFFPIVEKLWGEGKWTEHPREVRPGGLFGVLDGGTTGVLVATRLAKADPNLSILILEHGPNTRDNPLVVNPAFYLMNIAPDSPRASFYKSRPSKDLAGRESIIPTGRCLGGGSSINFMVYSRPQAIDFDAWNVPGWSGKDIIPMFKKYENFQVTDPAIDTSVHGYDGEFSVSSGTNAQPAFQKDFFKACSNVGISTTADIQSFHSANAKFNMWIDRETGLRQDVAHCLLFPLLDQGNTGLQVATNVSVNRILFNANKKATGVEYTIRGTKPAVVKARRLVVLASGVLGSPQVLERSGVGDKNLLLKLGIQVISDLPGVGSNYQDHNVIFSPYKSSDGVEETIDGVVGMDWTV
ncbi:Alcohol oxidase [Talaromyces pinophilus]|nr:Alcohol oxidase [Talaromyces pinophilus]